MFYTHTLNFKLVSILKTFFFSPVGGNLTTHMSVLPAYSSLNK